MINKVLKIKNIGKFKNLGSANDDLVFKEYTLIFGPNKHGKTTFTSILKSLKTSEIDHLVGRKTFGSVASDSQEYEILMSDGSKCTYNSGVQNEDIEIFDNEFIHKNVFSGDLIDKDNKSSLYNILLDDQNIKLKEQIDLLEKKQTIITTEKSNARNAIENFTEFIKLEPKDEIKDIIKKVEENNNKVARYINQAKLDELCKKTKFTFDFDVFEKSLKQTIDNTLESKIDEHIKNSHKKGNVKSRDFLKTGVELITEHDNCPFCNQSLSNVSDHVTILKTFFSATYKEIQESINNSIESFGDIDVEKEINAFKVYGLEFPRVDLVDLEVKLANIKNKLKEKQTDLSKDIKIEEDKDYIYFKNKISNLKKEIENITSIILDIDLLNKETKDLLLNKERFSIEGVEKYTIYKEKEREFEENKKEISEKTDKLKSDLNNLFQKHLEKINEVLTISGANFKLKKLDANTNRSLREHMCEYSFIFDNTYDVNLDGGNDIPTFKNTLSDSDKRVLAFAFFIAKIKSEDNIQSKMVVLDDPFTSLDEDRRDYMINILKDLGVSQIIILSHSRTFINRCYTKIKNINGVNLSTLKIIKENNTSRFDVLTEDEIILTDHEKNISDIKKTTEINIVDNFGKIRKAIEHILRAKYRHLMTINEIKLPMKFLDTDICPIDVNTKKLVKDNDYQEDHHDVNNPQTPNQMIGKRDDFIEKILPKL